MALLPLLLSTAPSLAVPLSFVGSTSTGMELDPLWSSAWLNHALDRRNGVGVSLQYLPLREQAPHGSGPDGDGSHASQGDETFLLLDWTRLVQRWNMPQAQANIWLVAGVGMYRASGTSRPSPDVTPEHHGDVGAASDPGQHQHPGAASLQPPTFSESLGDPSMHLAASPGLQLDIETTRLRLEARGRVFMAPGIQRSQLSATAGLALTPPVYKGVQPWLEVQVRAMPGVIDGVELIPRLRLLHHRLVLDLGVSSHGSLVGGFRYTL